MTAMPRSDGLSNLLRRMPKVDLHCHLIGALRQSTVVELAQVHAVPLPRPAASLYEFSTFENFIDALRLAAMVLRTRDDFDRAVYEVLEDAAVAGNLVHAEIMFNPQYHYAAGLTYKDMVLGLRDGLERARGQLGVSGLLVACIDRQIVPTAALEVLDDVLSHRCDLVAGVGIDGPEGAGPPQLFAEFFARAGRAGLRRTAHVCEDNQPLNLAPPAHYAICRDLLGCDRLDHGYNLLADGDAVRRAADDGLFFNVCTVTSAAHNRDRRMESIGRMREAGLRLTLNTDDPAMFKTDIAASYTALFDRLEWGEAEAREMGLAGIEASWLAEAAKGALRSRFLDEFARLTNEVGHA